MHNIYCIYVFDFQRQVWITYSAPGPQSTTRGPKFRPLCLCGPVHHWEAAAQTLSANAGDERKKLEDELIVSILFQPNWKARKNRKALKPLVFCERKSLVLSQRFLGNMSSNSKGRHSWRRKALRCLRARLSDFGLVCMVYDSYATKATHTYTHTLYPKPCGSSTGRPCVSAGLLWL